MKKLFTHVALVIFLSLSCASITLAQNSNKDLDELHKQMEKNQASMDSSRKFMDSMMSLRSILNDSAEKARYWENNARNLNALTKTMQERDKKQRQAAWLRIGLGIALLALGIFGVLRRRKKEKTV